MTLSKLLFPPGFDKRSTAYRAEGRWFDGDKVRSAGGVIETMGGWEKFFSDDAFLGVCRGIHAHTNSNGARILSFGTTRRLYVLSEGSLTNITPIRASGSLTDAITTTSGSTTVEIADTSHGLIDDAIANFSNQGAPVDGVTLSGDYTVTVIDSNNFTVEASGAATGSTAGAGGNLDYSYEINPGRAEAIDAFGHGVGTYGSGFYGTPRTSSLLLAARIWSLDNWGTDLVACAREGGVYDWDPSAGGRAAAISNAPTQSHKIFVAPTRHLVVLRPGGERLRVGWSDQEDNTTWTAAAGNQAGDIDLSGGSEILDGLPLRNDVNLIFTDTDCFQMIYLGQEPWFSFSKQGSGSGVFGPNAACELGGVAYWMANGTFYTYDSYVHEMPAVDEIKDFVFESISYKQRDKTFAFANKQFQEIWWLYQTMGADDVDRYVMFSIREQRWYTGTMARTAWADTDPFQYPLATSADGYVYEHEKGVDADGAALEKYITSGDFDLGDGEEHMDIFGVVPDFDEIGGTVTLTLFTRDYPGQSQRTDAEESITSTSERVDVRAAGRQSAIKWRSNEVGGCFRLGALRLDLQSAGRRR